MRSDLLVGVAAAIISVLSVAVWHSAYGSSRWAVWQIVVAVVSNLIATVFLVWLGAKVYERTLLRTDRRIGYREALTVSE